MLWLEGDIKWLQPLVIGAWRQEGAEIAGFGDYCVWSLQKPELSA